MKMGSQSRGLPVSAIAPTLLYVSYIHVTIHGVIDLIISSLNPINGTKTA